MSKSDIRIGVIGAGIGGSAFVYNLFEKNVDYQIDVLEKNEYLGGRVKTYLPYNIDQGAEYFVSSQPTILQLVDMINQKNPDNTLELQEYLSVRALYDRINDNFTLIASKKQKKLARIRWMLANMRYVGLKNIGSMSKLNSLVPRYAAEIEELFYLMEQASLDDLFEEINRRFANYIGQSLKDYMLSEGIAEEVIDKFVNPLFAPIYMLSANDIVSLHGALGFAAKTATVYHVKGGNSGLINLMWDNLRQCDNISLSTGVTVSHVKYLEDTDQFEVTYKSDKDEQKSVYDFLFMPIPYSAVSKIEFENFPKDVNTQLSKMRSVKYHEVYHHLVKGVPNKKLREIFSKGAETVFTNNTQTIWEINKVEDDVFDVTSTHPFDTTEFDLFFDTVDLINSVHWDQGYPKYTVDNIRNIPLSFKLMNNLVIGSESIISSMDTSVNIGFRTAELFQKTISKTMNIVNL